jgi:hypothetical protein
VDLFEPGSGSQVHDYNGGIPKNGLFWTVQVPSTAFRMNSERTRASLSAEDCPVIDSFEFAGPNIVPATVDVDVSWAATGPVEALGNGDSVPPDDPSAFSGRFRPARATGSFSGKQLGFRFRTDAGLSSDLGYAEIGSERNGAFL